MDMDVDLYGYSSRVSKFASTIVCNSIRRKQQMTDKVIEFPKHKVVRDVPDEVFEERNRKADMKVADAMVEEMAGFLLTELDNYDIEVESPAFVKDFIVVVDALKGAIYRHFGIEHAFHTFVDKNVSVYEADMGSLSKEEIQDKIDHIMADLVAAKEKLDNEVEE